MQPFKIIRINHVGLAGKVPAKTKDFFELLGFAEPSVEPVTTQQTLTTMYELESSRLEVLEPINNEGPIQNFLERFGGGIHHLALEVDHLDAALHFLKEHQVQLIDSVARQGAHGTRVAFIHPKATGGLLIELVEESKDHRL